MKLRELLKGLEYKTDSREDEFNKIEIEDIVYDSRKAKKDHIFVAIDGKTVDGHKYAKSAYEKGSRVFIVEKEVELGKDAVKIYVEDSRLALSKISANFFGNPSKKLKVIGITGTKGKTTISNYTREIFNMAGKKTGVIGTNGVFYGDKEETIHNTTPESYEIQRILSNMLKEGMTHVVMEVSSSGLMMHRVNDVDFDLGVFTNISRDHIGPKEHPTFEHYLNCKIKLFNICRYGIINGDDEYSDLIKEKARSPLETVGIENKVDFRAENIELSTDEDFLGVEFDYIYEDGKRKHFIMGSPGMFSVYNALIIINICRHFHIPFDIIYTGLKEIRVSGRVESLNLVKGSKIILDYAHNKDSLENILDTLREYTSNRLICLIGSVGGRSEERREEIGEVISTKCDMAILTSDNPDKEDPLSIIEDIHSNFKKDIPVIKEADREKAVYLGIKELEEGDILLLAGKGHEETQFINGEYIPYSDKESAKKAVTSLYG